MCAHTCMHVSPISIQLCKVSTETVIQNKSTFPHGVRWEGGKWLPVDGYCCSLVSTVRNMGNCRASGTVPATHCWRGKGSVAVSHKASMYPPWLLASCLTSALSTDHAPRHQPLSLPSRGLTHSGEETLLPGSQRKRKHLVFTPTRTLSTSPRQFYSCGFSNLQATTTA